MACVLKPEILTHPNVPKPLHGISPRTIMGQAWWDKTRREVYAKYDYICVACGVPKTEAMFHKWLEAHEYWKIDYETGICEIISIEPLCHACHNFIHSGRLSMIIGKEKSQSEAIQILEHGFKILADNKLQAFPFTVYLAERLEAETFGVDSYYLPDGDVAWSDWKLVFEGNEYHSRFSSFDDWKAHYKNGGK